MGTCISHSPDETATLGEEWGRGAATGWLIGLTGDLGAGKTQLVKGLARGLGTSARVRSPSFALVNEYLGGRLPLYHLDLYRLETPEALASAGLDDYFAGTDGVVVVEWFEHWQWPTPSGSSPVGSPGVAPARRWRHAWLEVLGETTRCIRYEDFGA